jgi:uncharacterized protein
MDASNSPTLTQLPLFPLQSVLFPGGYLPMRIFEVRYLDMIGRNHKAGAPFGVVCLTEGREVRLPSAPRGDDPSARGDGFAQEDFHDVGTLATITQLERPNPGLMVIQCTATQRFRVKRREQLKHGLWMADVELLPDDALVVVPHDLQSVSQALQELLQGLRERVADPSEIPLQPPYHWEDCGWLANRWCELLPVSAEQKYRFMTLDNPLLRLELVSDVLDQLGVAKSLGRKP